MEKLDELKASQLRKIGQSSKESLEYLVPNLFTR